MELRPYQIDAKNEIYAEWALGKQNVLVQLATGAGKTVVFSNIIAEYPGSSIAIAHRQELVSQISLTLARYGIRHHLIAQKAVIREIVSLHMQELGKSYFDPTARRYVAGVDTLIRLPLDTPWFKQIGLVVQDEGHHPQKNNKWGFAASLFPNAKGLYPTATPVRADGRGLGRHADGIMDSLVIGVGMSELIKMGYLTGYRIVCSPSDIDLTEVKITASGDFSPNPLRAAVHKSHITGDIVAHYLKFAAGKQGVTFAVDIEAATEIAMAFRKEGIPAEVITGKTPDLLRAQLMQQFRKGDIKQLVNVDILGEGVDVPGIEVVSMARPTMSYSLYSQQFGRALRPMPGKTRAIIIDHVGNIMRHRLPDACRTWTLDRRERRARSADPDAIPLRTCLNTECLGVYKRTLRTCPECGFYSPPTARSTPEQVDGDLLELDEKMLAKLRGEIDRIDSAPKINPYMDAGAQGGMKKSHIARQKAQAKLRVVIAYWAGILKAEGKNDSEIYRTFFYLFKTDIASAQTLGERLAFELMDKIQGVIDESRNMI